MQESWIPLQCPECNESWEATPADLPEPDESFVCDHCDAVRPTAEFTKTARGLEILRDFYES
ncbi:DUF7836 family putative zinc-binding protein [Halapricum salinum]|uniref:DUF7836 domain-containing protein n=1 Tax=Halapricum salinum TaxID=1457250 RepID=A0A4D6HCC8_9EURY|nr:hypothetical protein [Halapricum salinum]QCC50808.1 hypothetical protein DV733_05915 [Halapricum salinum]